MLLCLSSGFTPRYREDVLRATAIPAGGHLRFRYELGLIPDGLKASIGANELSGEDVCIGYLDRRDLTRIPEIVPCRRGKVIRSSILGDFCVLDFVLQEFSVARDIGAFNREVRAKAANLAHWQGESLSGHFCAKVEGLSSLTSTSQIEDWQFLIKALKEHGDFSNDRFFYFIQGVFEFGTEDPTKIEGGSYCLRADDSYEIRLVQFSPGETHDSLAVKDVSWLLVEPSPEGVSFITNKKLPIDSGYDEKFFRFRTGSTAKRLDATVSLFRQAKVSSDPKTENAIWDFDLQFSISAGWFTPIWKGALIGILIAAQGFIPVLSNPQIADKAVVGAGILVAGLFAGWAASFSLRKL